MATDDFQLRFTQGVRARSGIWYRNIETIGEGGNARVFLVTATNGLLRGCLFALKIFRRLSKPEWREAFLRESEFLTSVSHPAIMALWDAGVFQEKHPFVVAEYLPATLRDYLRSNELSLSDKISFALQLCSALAFLEQQPRPVVHRDIKPANIFVKGRACILGDFGLVKLAEFPDQHDRELIKQSAGVGMPIRYRTPDLVDYLNGGSAPSTKSDVFQLGLVLAELFTSVNPLVPCENIGDTVVLEDLAAITGPLGTPISDLLKNMLEMRPADRNAASKLIVSWQSLFLRAAGDQIRSTGRLWPR